MYRFAARLSVASLLVSVAALVVGCQNTPVDSEEHTARNAAAIEDGVAVPGDDGPIAAADPIALEPVAADAAEAPAKAGVDMKMGAPEPKECAGTWSYLPEGTDTWIQDDGSIGYKLPDGFVSIETDPSTGALAATTGGSITCSCTQGTGGCSPVAAGGKSGCFMGDNCSTCSKSGATKVVNTNAMVAFADPKEVVMLPHVTPALLKLQFVADALAQFKDQVAAEAGLQSGADLDDPKNGFSADPHTYIAAPGWSLAAVNLYGYIALISVPESYAMMAAPSWGSSQKCTCNAGSGCKAGSMLGAKYCDAGNCTSCTMGLSAAAATFMSTNETPACSAE
ncbi:MAG: hypothetical protein U0441_17485 [Polyangiaceae bacterium]